ncbi:MAG: tRNA threonylcarbamoyladenosine dehydratase, partial [Rubrivivax sp.]|nr:tRNA threonylcarbamoyladenosine dehydratase [Rubrivivax sp.]
MAHGPSSAPVLAAQPLGAPDLDADLERRFGGLRRLYGEAGYARLRAARFAVVGLGGVGSWAAEALARSGVAELVLVDLDHVAESNVNRQVQALTPTLGQAKVQALAERIALIHPGCRVHAVEEFASADNWPGLLPVPVDGLVDACDQVRAKEALASWSLQAGVPCVVAGAAGGKRRPEAVEVADLAEVTHDPLLAALRQRLRRAGVLPRAKTGPPQGKSGLACVFSREAVALPMRDDVDTGEEAACEVPGTVDGSLNCAGYGSSVMVTATFG